MPNSREGRNCSKSFDEEIHKCNYDKKIQNNGEAFQHKILQEDALIFKPIVSATVPVGGEEGGRLKNEEPPPLLQTVQNHKKLSMEK